MTKKTGMGCFAIFIGILYLVGFGVLGYGLLTARRATAPAGWPTTPGTIANLDLTEGSDEDSTTYEVKVQYTYTVAGTPYRGSRLAFGYGATSFRDAHAKLYEKLKGAKSVDVRYDPADPASAVLSF